MKKTLLILMLSLLTLVCGAQKKIYTKKAIIADFNTKTTKVVMSGNTLLDLSLRNEVSARWRISPYEFCEYSEWDALKTSTSFYFLRLMQDEHFVYLSLVKGGKDSDENPLNKRHTVIEIPIARSGESNGREYVFMPAFLDAIQNFVEDAMASDRVGYMGLSSYSDAVTRTGGKTIFFAQSDVTQAIKDSDREQIFDGSTVILTTEDAVDNVFNNAQPGTIVSFTVSPASDSKGLPCYRMLFAADTHELVYFKKMISVGSASKGFSVNELRSISKARGKAR